MIIAGSARVGKYPVGQDLPLDWTPVDYVARSTVELALRNEPEGSASVHHITNPTLCTYADMVRCFNEVGLPMEAVSPKEWWAAIQADESNPCLAMEAYIESAVVEAHSDLSKTGGKPLVLDISRTLTLAPNSLAKCPPLDAALWKKYLRHWKQIGFISQ